MSIPNISEVSLDTFYIGGFKYHDERHADNNEGYVSWETENQGAGEYKRGPKERKFKHFLQAVAQHTGEKTAESRIQSVSSSIGDIQSQKVYAGFRSLKTICTKAGNDVRASMRKVHRRTLESRYTKTDLTNALYFLEAYALKKAVDTAREERKVHKEAKYSLDDPSPSEKKLRIMGVAMDVIHAIHDCQEAANAPARNDRRASMIQPSERLDKHMKKLKAASSGDEMALYGIRLEKALAIIEVFKKR